MATAQLTKELETERTRLLELLSAQHDPDRVARRKMQVLEFLRSNTDNEKTGVIVLALQEVVDEILYNMLTQAKNAQSNPTLNRKIILLD